MTKKKTQTKNKTVRTLHGVRVDLTDKTWKVLKASAEAAHRTLRAECMMRLELSADADAEAKGAVA